MWWLPSADGAGALPALAGAGAALAGRAGAGANAEGGGAGGIGAGGGELLRLAAAQRMSTEARRAVFCVVLDSQDCADALERLLRLPLKARPRPCCAGREASRCQE
jgi:nucleolar MIF4G domain-containing protein 1